MKLIKSIILVFSGMFLGATGGHYYYTKVYFPRVAEAARLFSKKVIEESEHMDLRVLVEDKVIYQVVRNEGTEKALILIRKGIVKFYKTYNSKDTKSKYIKSALDTIEKDYKTYDITEEELFEDVGKKNGPYNSSLENTKENYDAFLPELSVFLKTLFDVPKMIEND